MTVWSHLIVKIVKKIFFFLFSVLEYPAIKTNDPVIARKSKLDYTVNNSETENEEIMKKRILWELHLRLFHNVGSKDDSDRILEHWSVQSFFIPYDEYNLPGRDSTNSLLIICYLNKLESSGVLYAPYLYRLFMTDIKILVPIQFSSDAKRKWRIYRTYCAENVKCFNFFFLNRCPQASARFRLPRRRSGPTCSVPVE